MLRALFLAATVFFGPYAHSFSEAGHHAIAVIAFEKLSDTDQAEMIRLIKAHPRFEQDFKPPPGVLNGNHWLVGRACDWPRVAKQLKEWNRPRWHYEYEVSVGLLRPEKLTEVKARPVKLPENATMGTAELRASQAYELCRQRFENVRLDDADRAVALCWMLHIACNLHEPLGTGGLKGDERGRLVHLKRGKNLFEFWNEHFGGSYDEDKVQSSVNWIRDGYYGKLNLFGKETHESKYGGVDASDDAVGPELWIREGRRLCKEFVYPVDLRARMIATAEGNGTFSPPPEYIENAEKVIRVRAKLATERIASQIAWGL